MNLGERNHRYLGLVFTNQEYAIIPYTVPFIPPNYPPALNIPTDATPI